MSRAGWRSLSTLCAAVMLAGCTTQTTPSAAPSPTPEALAHFSAPGIAFDYPALWVNETALYRTGGPVLGEADLPNVHGERLIAMLVDPGRGDVDTWPLILVSEYLHALPTDNPVGVRDTKIDGQWARREIASDGWGPNGDQRVERWYVAGPDGGFYSIWFQFPTDNLAWWRPRVDAVMASLTFTDWTLAPAPTVDGKIHYDTDVLGFDYPAGWQIYYPLPDQSTAGAVFLAVSSEPLGTCSDEFHCSNVPRTKGAVAVRFSWPTVMWEPDWSTANDTVAGLPAIRTDESWTTGTGGEYLSWGVRDGTRPNALISIDAALAPPDLPELRQTLADLVASVRITPPVDPSPDPPTTPESSP